jgi:hypothetical protein
MRLALRSTDSAKDLPCRSSPLSHQINTPAAASSIRLSKTNLVAVICRSPSESPRWGSIELYGKYLVGAAGLGALLPVEPVAQDGGMTVDLLAHSHDVAEGPMRDGHSPRREGERIHLVEIGAVRDVLLREPQLGYRDERRELLGPFDGDVLDRRLG